jgi:hypothetical protein
MTGLPICGLVAASRLFAFFFYLSHDFVLCPLSFIFLSYSFSYSSIHLWNLGVSITEKLRSRMVALYGRNRIDGLHGVGWTLTIYIPPLFTVRRTDCIAIL